MPAKHIPLHWFITPHKRPRRWLVVCSALVALYAVLLGVVAPWFAIRHAPAIISQALHNTTTIERISINPFTLRFTLEGVALTYPGGNDPFFSARRVVLDHGISSVLRFAPALHAVTVEQPILHFSLEQDGTTSFSQFARPGEQAKQEEGKPDRLFPLVLNNITIDGGTIEFADNMHGTHHTLKDLFLFVPFTSTLPADQARQVRPTLNATLDGSIIGLEGRTRPFSESLATSFRMHLGEIALEQLRPYLTAYTSLTLDGGIATAEISLEFERHEEGTNISLAGSLHVADLRLSAPQEGVVLEVPFGVIEAERVLPEHGRFSLREVVLENPVVLVARKADGSMNWSRYLTPQPPANTAPAKGEAPAAAKPGEAGTPPQPAGNAAVAAETNATQPQTNGTMPQTNSTVAQANGTMPQANGTVAQTNSTAIETNGTASGVAFVPPVPNPNAGPLFALEQFTITNAKVLWRDATLGSTFQQEIYPLNIQAKRLATEAPEQNTGAEQPAPGVTASPFTGLATAVAPAPSSTAGQPPVQGLAEAGNTGHMLATESSGLFSITLGSAVSADPKETEAFFQQALALEADAAQKMAEATAPATEEMTTTPEALVQNATAQNAAGQEGQAQGNATAPATSGLATSAPEAAQAPKPATAPLGNMALRGTVQLYPFVLDARVRVNSFPMERIGPYTALSGLAMQGGLLNIDTQCRLAIQNGMPHLALQEGALSLHDFVVTVPFPGGSAVARLQNLLVRRVTVNPETSLLTLGSVVVDAPQFSAVLAAPGKEASPATAPTAGPSAPAKESATGAPTGSRAEGTANKALDVTIESLGLKDGRLDITNEAAVKAPLNITGFALTGSNVSTLPGQKISMEASGTWNGSGKLGIKGTGTVTPLNLAFNTALSKVPLRSLGPWLAAISTLEVKQGVVSCDINVNVAQSGIAVKAEPKAGATAQRNAPHPGAIATPSLPRQESKAAEHGVGLALAGKMEADEMVLLEEGREVFSLDHMKLLGLRGNTAARTFDITTLRLEGPRLSFSRYPEGINTLTKAFDVTGALTANAKARYKQLGTVTLEQAMKAAEQTAAKAPNTPISPAVTLYADGPQHSVVPGLARLSIATLQMEGGAVRFHDETLARRASVSFSNLNMKATGLSSASRQPASFTLAGKAEGAPLQLSATANPFFLPLQAKATASLKGMDMIPLSPYAEQFLAYPISKGALFLDSTVQTDGQVLSAQNSITLGGLQLGAQVPGRTPPNVPIKTGLSLLADSKGDVRIDLPISGKLGDPQFRVGNVVTNVIGNMFFKVVASPFNLLGAVISGLDSGGPSLDSIVFAPGDDRLDAKGAKVIAAVVELLQKHPKIAVVLHGMADEAEKTQLVAAFIRKGVEEAKWNSLGRKERETKRSTDMRVDPRLTPAEYEEFLFDFYKEADIPDKPSTLGLVKKQPVSVMLQMLEKTVAVNDKALESLALARAAAVKAEIVRLDASLAGRVAVDPTPKLREAGSGQPLYSRVEFGVADKGK
ncbi:DUF748 domain-containing protein [Desulfovibrio cuneatus]|uniref:DUF748 domain-containing protein n=1 Tax=Desulfovibrio cuneatus TaxID=159728 RepID=UPI0003F7AC4B|nr:DUF748 domain-containing protein [Desulfovibrio cuneatus]